MSRFVKLKLVRTVDLQLSIDLQQKVTRHGTIAVSAQVLSDQSTSHVSILEIMIKNLHRSTTRVDLLFIYVLRSITADSNAPRHQSRSARVISRIRADAKMVHGLFRISNSTERPQRSLYLCSIIYYQQTVPRHGQHGRSARVISRIYRANLRIRNIL